MITEALAILVLLAAGLWFGYRGRSFFAPICYILIGVILAGGTFTGAASHGGHIVTTVATQLASYVGGKA
jgi:hypothetical protein